MQGQFFSVESFWQKLVEGIEKERDWRRMYVGPQLRWTDFIINILKKIGTDLGFEVAKEYFGIDVGYFTVDSKDRFD